MPGSDAIPEGLDLPLRGGVAVDGQAVQRGEPAIVGGSGRPVLRQQPAVGGERVVLQRHQLPGESRLQLLDEQPGRREHLGGLVEQPRYEPRLAGRDDDRAE